MGELGELLERMHGAVESLDRVELECRHWHQSTRASAALTRDMGDASTFGVVGAMAGESVSEEWESAVRCCFERPDRVREERESQWQGKRMGVRVGSRWWRFAPHEGAISNEGYEAAGSVIGHELEVLLDPWRLLGAVRVESQGYGERAGRQVLRARATPAVERSDPRARVLHSFGPGADDYLLEVDVERGVLLRFEALFEGLPFLVVEAQKVNFDRPFAPSTFVLEPPAGETVRPFEPPPHPTTVALHEAATSAPFTVPVPASVPERWHLEVMFTPAGQPPWTGAPSVNLSYRSHDAATELNINETARQDGQGLGFGTGAPPWEEIEREGIRMSLRDRDESWPQAQLSMDKGDTAIFMHSASLDGHAPVSFATRLVPAATERPRL